MDTIMGTYAVPGAFYIEISAEDFHTTGSDKSLTNITQVNVRAFVFVGVENTYNGLLCPMGVGMSQDGCRDITLHEVTKSRKRYSGYIPRWGIYISFTFRVRC